jgi:NTP pyrophosphatase (non-canonical NTP hydrolase)
MQPDDHPERGDAPAAGDGTLRDLTARVLRHRDEREWAQFHTPKELAVSLVVEAGELLSLMQWKSGDDLRAALDKRREQVRDELADVLHSTLLLADDLGIDLAAALEQKLAKDAQKYPVEKSRGRAEKYTDL